MLDELCLLRAIEDGVHVLEDLGDVVGVELLRSRSDGVRFVAVGHVLLVVQRLHEGIEVGDELIVDFFERNGIWLAPAAFHEGYEFSADLVIAIILDLRPAARHSETFSSANIRKDSDLVP